MKEYTALNSNLEPKTSSKVKVIKYIESKLFLTLSFPVRNQDVRLVERTLQSCTIPKEKMNLKLCQMVRALLKYMHPIVFVYFVITSLSLCITRLVS